MEITPQSLQRLLPYFPFPKHLSSTILTYCLFRKRTLIEMLPLSTLSCQSQSNYLRKSLLDYGNPLSRPWLCSAHRAHSSASTRWLHALLPISHILLWNDGKNPSRKHSPGSQVDQEIRTTIAMDSAVLPVEL